MIIQDLGTPNHGLINYIDTKAKCSHLKKLTCKGTLRQVFICLSYIPLPLHTVYVHVLIHIGDGGELNQREGERGNRSQSWVENTNMAECTQEIGYLHSLITPAAKSLSVADPDP
jgi:hypothetical protein